VNRVNRVNRAAGMRAHAILLDVAHRLLVIDRERFGDAGAEFAEAEGEGDGSLADRRAAHQRYFEAEGARIGIPFTDNADIDDEDFRVLRVFQRPA